MNHDDKKTDNPQLDDILVALQKTFSRLSSKSKDVDENEPRALIIDNVDFELSLNVIPSSLVSEDKKPNNDYLLYTDSKSGFPLTLRGTIQTDIRIKEDKNE